MTTANLGMTKATVGGSTDTWGTSDNVNFDLIDAFAGKLMGAAEVTVASATTCDIGAAASTAVAVSGTVTITGFGSSTNTIRFVRFTGALTLTHHATSLILLDGVSRATVAGDVGIYKSDGSGNWREMSFSRCKRPRFLAYNASTVTNQTGNGLNPTVTFGTEDFDDGGNFASNTFTAPVTGKYRLSARVVVSALSTAMTNQQIAIITTSKTYVGPQDVLPLSAGALTLTITETVDMTVGDTALIKVQVANGAGNTASFLGDATIRYTTFSGELVG